MSGCLNRGSCSFDEEKDSFACSCKPPWSGKKCERGKFNGSETDGVSDKKRA